MLALEISEVGGPDVLRAVERAVPTPGSGELLVRNEAIGVNLFDTYQRSGLYQTPLPAILGTEGAGRVEAIGEGVTRFKAGDRVAYAAGGAGAYAEARVVASTRATLIPEGISADTAAACLLKGMMAEALLRRCYPIAPGDPILIHAAAGGVGLMMSQWARAIGALVIGTVGSDAKAKIALANGCHHAIRYDTEDFAARVREITNGSGVRVVYDGVGAATLDGSLASLGRRGLLVGYGNASGPAPAIDPMKLMRGGSLYFTRMSLSDFIATPGEFGATAKAVFDMVASGAAKVHIGQRFALADGAAAHRALESRATIGSTILTV